MKTLLGLADRALCFAAVADTGSFTAAAARLGCSKAHVSKEVAALERDLGAHLVHRTTRRLSLTESGRLYLDYCHGLRETLEEADRAVSALRSDVGGRLRISVPTSFGEAFMPDIVLDFRRQYPNVDIDLDVSVVRRDLAADGFDLALRSSRTIEDRMVAKPLGVVRDVVVAAPALVERRGAPRRPEDLAALPCIVNSHFADDRLWAFEREGAQVTVTVDGPLRVNSYGAIRRMATAGAGYARLPLYLVGGDVAHGALLRLCADWRLASTPLYLVHPERRHVPLRTRVFMDHVSAWFAAEERRELFS